MTVRRLFAAWNCRLLVWLPVLFGACAPGTGGDDSIGLDQVREVWRVGGHDDDNVRLTSPVGGAFGPGGMTAIADERLPGVIVLDGEGRLVLSLDRRGDGPGEFQQARAVGFTDGGVWAWDPTRLQITWFDLDGQVIRTRPLSREQIRGYGLRGGELLANGWILEESIAPRDFTTSDLPPVPILIRDNRDSLRLIASSPQPGPVYAERPMRNGFFSMGPQFILADPIIGMTSGGGSFFVVDRPIPEGSTAVFTATRFSSVGDTIRTWSRRTAASGDASEIEDSISARVDEWLAEASSPIVAQQFERESTIESYWVPGALPPVSRVVADPHGFWIGREPFREPRVWERYSLTGRLERRIELPSGEEVLASDGATILTQSDDSLGTPIVRLLNVGSRDER